MFSHPPAEPPGPAATVRGDPALDARWRAATAGWRPSAIRSVDADRVWAWVRHAWEGLLAPGPGDEALDDDDADDGDADAGPGPRVRDVLTVAALLVLQERFLAVAAGERPAAGVPDPRREGAPLDDDEVLAVVRRLWDLEPERAEEDPDGFAAELAGFLQDHLDERAEDVREQLLARHGATQVFAELWSLEHGDELDPEQEGERPFPLSTDDVAWIVSGVPGPEKHTAWEWLTR
ncbi:hypothetical protein ACH9EU_00145 [Kocuria sp. M1R5S2]|uniref:hypothetical protein n=1 Tax=Kocuria rhizosphaerae TaxID=3376285 RepID=UPI003789C81F